MKRLIRNYKKKVTAASSYMHLDSILLDSGDHIQFEARTLNNKPWFQVSHSSRFNNSSYYDGPDFEKACKVYSEILLAFKGVKKAEQFVKSQDILKNKIEKMQDYYQKMTLKDMYPGLKQEPLFLGNNEF
ncbi:MAG: hypothetical protein ACOCRK_01660 [bacterium]